MTISIADLIGIEIPSWQSDSLCSNETYNPDWWLSNNNRKNDTIKAKKICNACPVKQECLSWAIKLSKSGAIAGVYGGTTEQERRAMRICMYGPCNELVQKVNLQPRAQNNFCSLEHQELHKKFNQTKRKNNGKGTAAAD